MEANRKNQDEQATHESNPSAEEIFAQEITRQRKELQEVQRQENAKRNEIRKNLADFHEAMDDYSAKVNDALRQDAEARKRRMEEMKKRVAMMMEDGATEGTMK